MISKAPDVPSYIEEVPEERRAVIETLRDLCRRILKGYQESIEYGMPGYKRNGVVEIAFASQKNYVAVYVLKKSVLDEFRPQLARCSDIGKGCIRFKKPAAIDFALLERLLRRNVESTEAPC